MDKSMQRLVRIFGGESAEEPQAGGGGEEAAPRTTISMGQGANNPSPDPYDFPPLPTAAEIEAMFPDMSYLKTSPDYCREKREISKPPAEDAVRRFFSRPMLGKRISRAESIRQTEMHLDNYYRRVPTVAEQVAAHKRNQALRRDRQQRKDLVPEAYRESKLNESETCIMSDALRARLAELAVSTPPSCVFVDEFSKEQAKAATKYGRFSMYADRRSRHVAQIFTDDEFDNLESEGRGRDMPVFDREGRRYEFDFTYSEEDSFYRLTGVGAEYERFMTGNHVMKLGKRVTMQLFAFRSAKLLPEDKGFRDHPDGALGMIILFSESELDDEYADWIELEDDSMTVKEMFEHIQHNQTTAEQ